MNGIPFKNGACTVTIEDMLYSKPEGKNA